MKFGRFQTNDRITEGDRRLRHRLDLIETDKTRSNVIKLSLFVLMTLAVTLLMIHTIMGGTRPGPKLYVVQNERISERFEAPALILRQEEVLTAPSDGIFHPVAAEATRNSSGSLIGMIVSKEHQGLVEEADQLAQKISERQIALIQEGSNAELLERHFEWDANLLPLIEQLRVASQDANIMAIHDSEIHLDEQMRQRTQSNILHTYQDETLTELVEAYQAKQAQLKEQSKGIYSKQAGYLSYVVDPSENYWTLEDFPADPAVTPTPPASMTPGDYPNVVKAPPGSPIDATKLKERLSQMPLMQRTNEPIEAGTPVARLMTGAWQEFHYLLPKRGNWVEGARYDIAIPSDQRVIEGAQLTAIYPTEEGYHLVLRTDKEVERLAGREVLMTELLQPMPRSLAVPVEAIMTDRRSTDLEDDAYNIPLPYEIDSWDQVPQPAEGRTSVYRLESGYVRQIPVEVISVTESYALIRSPEDFANPLTEGQIIILNPDSSQGGQRIGR